VRSIMTGNDPIKITWTDLCYTVKVKTTK